MSLKPKNNADVSVLSMRVHDMKQELLSYGKPVDHFLEKQELVNALVEARQEHKQKRELATVSSSASSTKRQRCNNPYLKSSSSSSSCTAEISSMKIPAIKQELLSYGKSVDQFLEKREMVEALVAARQEQKATGFVAASFKLLKTDLDRQSNDPLVQEHCLSMRQMLGLNPSTAGFQMAGNCRMEWLVISNFMVDGDFLWTTLLPELASIPFCVIFYEQYFGGVMNRGNKNVAFVEISPKEEPRSSSNPHSANPLRYRFHYGCHHTKMFLVGRSNGTLRVIIHTANLLQGDNEVKAQGAFIQDFPLKTAGSPNSSQFEDDLVDYMTTYGYANRKKWGRQQECATTLCDELKRYDFIGAKGVLIASTPGYYDLGTSTAGAHNRGYLKLSRAIRENCPASSSSSQPIVCQFSSIGALSERYLKEFATKLNAGRQTCDSLEKSLRIVFPTPECIRNSVEGYSGGGTVPSKKTNVNKAVLQPLWHKWASSPMTTMNPLHKPRSVPHIKTFYQLGEDNESMQWFCLSSHNLSKAAWGEIRQNSRGQHLYVMHWELGVFVAPSMFQEEESARPAKLVPITTTSTSVGGEGSTVAAAASATKIGIPLPYPLIPTKYGPSEKPFSWEETYAGAPDRFGRFGVMG